MKVTECYMLLSLLNNYNKNITLDNSISSKFLTSQLFCSHFANYPFLSLVLHVCNQAYLCVFFKYIAATRNAHYSNILLFKGRKATDKCLGRTTGTPQVYLENLASLSLSPWVGLEPTRWEARQSKELQIRNITIMPRSHSTPSITVNMASAILFLIIRTFPPCLIV